VRRRRKNNGGRKNNGEVKEEKGRDEIFETVNLL
jgi:hypothetical protein